MPGGGDDLTPGAPSVPSFPGDGLASASGEKLSALDRVGGESLAATCVVRSTSTAAPGDWPPSPVRAAHAVSPPGTFSAGAPDRQSPESLSATYRIADRHVTLQQALPELELFRVGVKTGEAPRPRRLPAQAPFSFERIAYFGGTIRSVQCTWAHAGCRLRISALGEIQIDGTGRSVGWTPRPGATRDELGHLHQAVIETGLVLALALQGVWCLHAESVERTAPELPDGAEVLGFLGCAEAERPKLAASLAGMSQDTRHLARRRGRRLRLAGDGILPWTLAPTPRALPRFPQPGYPPDRQPASLVARDLPLVELFCLDPQQLPDRPDPDDARRPTSVVMPLRPQQAALALIRHTAGSTFFSQRLLARHFDDCAVAVRWLRVLRLPVPERRDALAQILRTVAAAQRPVPVDQPPVGVPAV